MQPGFFASALLAATHQGGPLPLDAVTFAAKPDVVFVPVKDVATTFKLPVNFDPAKRTVTLNGIPVKPDARLMDGTVLLSVSNLTQWGVTASWNQETHTATLKANDIETDVKVGDKRVVVDKARQVLEAYQGQRLILQTNVSTGRPGHGTPSGDFQAGPAKERVHYSHLYDNAPMPYAVEVHGNVFIHGYTSVPPYPASHGCVRMPLNHGNPAKFFYSWVDVGTPVTISGTYVWHARHRSHHRRHR